MSVLFIFVFILHFFCHLFINQFFILSYTGSYILSKLYYILSWAYILLKWSGYTKKITIISQQLFSYLPLPLSPSLSLSLSLLAPSLPPSLPLNIVQPRLHWSALLRSSYAKHLVQNCNVSVHIYTCMQINWLNLSAGYEVWTQIDWVTKSGHRLTFFNASLFAINFDHH